jgi:hypothetical protein
MQNTLRVTSPLRAVLVVSALACAGLALPAQGAAASTAVNCASDSLQTAITNAASGATLVVSGWCEANFDILKNITIVGTPGAVLSADDSGNVIGIGGAYTVTLKSLEITDGRAANGGGIYAPDGGALTLDHVSFVDNAAVSSTSAAGGALYYLGNGLRITHSTFTNNQAEVYGAAAVIAQGGGAYVDGASSVDHTTFSNNSAAISTTASSSIAAVGAGLAVTNGPLTVSSSAFTSNTTRSSVQNAVAGDLGGGSGAGLSVDSAGDAPVAVTGSTFTNNTETVGAPWGGANGAGASFGLDFTGKLTLTSDTFSNNTITTTTTGPNGGTSGSAGLYVDAKTAHLSLVKVAGNATTVDAASTGQVLGGGAHIVAGLDTISKSLFSNNSAKVAVAGTAQFNTADVIGGGADIETGASGLTVSASTVANNAVSVSSVIGGSSVNGGGLAVSVFTSPSKKDRIVNSTIAKNSIIVKGPASNIAEGGGIYSSDPAIRLQFDTVVSNAASGATKASSKGGGVAWINSGVTPASVEASLLLGNKAGSGSSCAGTLQSKGYNAFAGLGGCSITPKHSDVVNSSTKKAALGKLAANGGPTKTIAIGADSTALNRIPRSTCRAIVTRDQRGVTRPQGGTCDEGAFERRAKH